MVFASFHGRAVQWPRLTLESDLQLGHHRRNQPTSANWTPIRAVTSAASHPASFNVASAGQRRDKHPSLCTLPSRSGTADIQVNEGAHPRVRRGVGDDWMKDTLNFSLVRGAESANLASGNPRAARWSKIPASGGRQRCCPIPRQFPVAPSASGTTGVRRSYHVSLPGGPSPYYSLGPITSRSNRRFLFHFFTILANLC